MSRALSRQFFSLLIGTFILMLLIHPFQTKGFPQELDSADTSTTHYYDTLYGANLGWRSGDKAGSSLAMGDVDGDGTQDIIIGSPYAASEMDNRIDSGVISIVFDSSLEELNGSFDLVNADCRIYGNVSNQLLGFSLACADVDGDGIDDIITGAPGYGPPTPGQIEADPEESYLGGFYVINGRPKEQFPQYAEVKDVTRFFALGMSKNQQLGYNVEVGDINGDSKVDLLVSAIEKDPMAASIKFGGTGKIYVFLGPDLPRGLVGTENASVRIIGGTQGEGAGFSLECGDINNDSIDDVIIGAPYYGPYLVAMGSGKIYAIYGNKTPSKNISLMEADLVISGNEAGSMFGHDLACGDFDKDSVTDLVVSAPTKSVGVHTEAGMVLVFKGGPILAGAKNIGNSSYAYTGGGAGDNAGTSLDFVMLDQYKTYLAVGSPRSNGSSPEGVLVGEVHLLECRTGRGEGVSTLPESAEHVIFGAKDGDLFGSRVGGITVNSGMATRRLIISAKEADGEEGNRPNSGIIYLFRYDPKGSPDPIGPGSGTDNITVPEGMDWKDIVLILAIVTGFGLVFLAVVVFRYKKRKEV